MGKVKELKKDSVKDVLDELENIYGIEKCKDDIKRYAKYLTLRNKNKINIGNFNVLIKCENQYAQIDELVQVIIQLLKLNKIANSSYLYIDERQLRNSYRNNELDDKEIVIIDSDVVNIFSSHIQDEIHQCMQKNNDKIFIIINKEDEDYFWRQKFKSKDIFWAFELDEITEKDKTNYIKQVLNQNSMTLDNNCNLINAMSNNDYEKVQKDLINIIVDCKSKKIDKITDKVLEDLDLREYLRIRNKHTTQKKTGMQELKTLEGLTEVKQQVQNILNYIQVNKNRGALPSLHMSFEGNPGSGKTSVARIIGKIFSEEKILSNNKNFVEIHARDLVAQYVGWTAIQTKEIINKAKGGVLFIDEAYALCSDRKSFEQEAIDTLIKEMEDKRSEICIILAGYTKEMQQLFEMNPGFSSRVNFHIQFPDYTEQELYNILKKMMKQENVKLSNNTKDLLLEFFKNEKKKDKFSNGRSVRNFYEKLKFIQADRVVSDKKADVNLIKKCDIEKAISQLALSGKIRTRIGFEN